MPETGARLPRFYFEGELRAGAAIRLPAEIERHVRVLRLRAAERIVLFDGRGGEFEARLVALERSGIRAALGEQRDLERESPLPVALVQGISSRERMDVTIQKAVELGVASIQPVVCGRSVVRLSAERAASRLEHWRRIAIAACEQCGRNRVPPVAAPVALAEACRAPLEGELRLALSPDGREDLKALLAGGAARVVLAAGPEGGFSAEEEALLARAGFAAVRLGPRILRTETAAAAALAALNVLQGDF